MLRERRARSRSESEKPKSGYEEKPLKLRVIARASDRLPKRRQLLKLLSQHPKLLLGMG